MRQVPDSVVPVDDDAEAGRSAPPGPVEPSVANPESAMAKAYVPVAPNVPSAIKVRILDSDRAWV